MPTTTQPAAAPQPTCHACSTSLSAWGATCPACLETPGDRLRALRALAAQAGADVQLTLDRVRCYAGPAPVLTDHVARRARAAAHWGRRVQALTEAAHTGWVDGHAPTGHCPYCGAVYSRCRAQACTAYLRD